MHTSPVGNHEIEKISGDAGTITARGTDMESLGLQMRESAKILQRIADGAEGKGYSMEKVRDKVGDLHVDLGKAGDRYEPSGKVIKEYGKALADEQAKISGIVDDCVELWAVYESKASALDGLDDTEPPDDETPEAKTAREKGVSDASGDKTAAYTAWREKAGEYDAPYDNWNEAYNAAYDGLKDANDDGVEDGFWDNAMPFIEGALIVLQIAGVILAIAAIIIGGPFILLAAAIVAGLILVLTIAKVANGRGGWQDIAWAVVGVIPFGRLGNLLGGGLRQGSTWAKFFKGAGADMIGLTAFKEVKALRALAGISSAPVLNAAGNVVTSTGIVSRMRTFAGTVENLPYNTPAGWLARIQGGSGGELADGIRRAYAAQTAGSNIARMDAILNGSALEGMQTAVTGVQHWGSVANAFDAVGKPLIDTYQMQDDARSGPPADQWAQQLANSR